MENLPTLVHCSDLMSHPHRLPLPLCFASTEVRLLIRDGDGEGGGGGEGVKARPRAHDPEDRGGRGPPPEQWKRCRLAIEQQLVYYASAVSVAVLVQSHKDNVRCNATE